MNLDLNLNFLAQVQALIESGMVLPPTGMSLPSLTDNLDPGIDQLADLDFLISGATGGTKTLEQWMASGGGSGLEFLSQNGFGQNNAMKALQGRLPSLALNMVSTPIGGEGSFIGFLTAQSGTVGPNTLTATGALTEVPSSMLNLPQRVGGAGWGQSLADRVVWLTGREHQIAELKLNPPNLGPLEVRVVVQQDQASVSFLSQHAVVREAIEQAMPRLRDMLEQQDLRLVQANIGERSDRGHEAGGRDRRTSDGRSGGEKASDGDWERGEAVTSPSSGLGLVDLFA
jgi:flagellar hook-length control protein FliK